jgi:hypothetical protein
MQTTLNLLTRNGVVFMGFKPALNAHQYAMLLEIAKAAQTADELRNTIADWAASQSLTVRFDE